jgi:hypothetical protein
MNMSPLDLVVLRQERLQQLENLNKYYVYDEFTAASQSNLFSDLIRQAKQWFEHRQFRSGSARRAHAAV